MAQKTILQPSDVVLFTNVQKDFPKCEIKSIFSMEYCEFTQCLGSAFQTRLFEDLVVYDCQYYDNAQAYSIGDTVFYEGVVRIAIQAGTGNLPSNHEFWENAVRFATPCLETLWCNFLGPYLAWSMVLIQLPFVHLKIGPAGLVKILGPNIQPGSTSDYRAVQAAILANKETAFLNLDHYMRNNNSDGCFDDYKGNAVTCCGDCGYLTDDCTCSNDCIDHQSRGYANQWG